MSEKDNKTIVFIETKKRVEEITRKMRRDGWPAESIHGDKNQNERDHVLQGIHLHLFVYLSNRAQTLILNILKKKLLKLMAQIERKS